MKPTGWVLPGFLNPAIKTEDTELVGRQRAKPNKIEARSSRPTCTNCSRHYNGTQYCR